MKYKILISDTCLSLVAKIPDKKIRRAILNRIERLSNEPDKQGKMLVQDLSGFRSIGTDGRYRIIYEIDMQIVVIYVLAAGIKKQGDKKDIYKIAKKLLTTGLLDLQTDET